MVQVGDRASMADLTAQEVVRVLAGALIAQGGAGFAGGPDLGGGGPGRGGAERDAGGPGLEGGFCRAGGRADTAAGLATSSAFKDGRAGGTPLVGGFFGGGADD